MRSSLRRVVWPEAGALLLYNFCIAVGLLLGWPLLLGWLCCSAKARSGFWQKLGCYPAALRSRLAVRNNRPRLWIHAVSVGEFNAIRPLLADLAPTYELVVSTTTRTGQQLAQQAVGNHLPVLYFPYDLPSAVSSALTVIDPDLVLLTETELWPNLIHRAVRQAGVPVLLINGRLSGRSFLGYRRLRFLLAPILRLLHAALMQTEADAARIQTLGMPATNVRVMGNIKFDVTPAPGEAAFALLQQALGFQPATAGPAVETPLLVMASTHAGEDGPMLGLYRQLQAALPQLRLVLAPRHPERGPDVARLLEDSGLSFVQRSRMGQAAAAEPSRVLLLDTVGELAGVYAWATVVVVGGSFVPVGGHNPLEVLVHGKPVLFGPHMENFEGVAGQVTAVGAGLQVTSVAEAAETVTRLLHQPAERQAMAVAGQALLRAHAGATQRLVREIQEALLMQAQLSIP